MFITALTLLGYITYIILIGCLIKEGLWFVRYSLTNEHDTKPRILAAVIGVGVGCVVFAASPAIIGCTPQIFDMIRGNPL